MSSLILQPVEITGHREIAKDVHILTFKRPWQFLAGQVIGIGTYEKDEPRLYSIASGENENEVDVLYNVNPGGKLTPWMAAAKPGNELWVSEPFGAFTATDDPAWWIATGTGIAPYISMIRSGFGAKNHLIHGARNDEGFYFADMLQKEMGDRYVRCSSRTESPDVFKGRVTDFLRQTEIPPDRRFYLCGNAEMVVEARDVLIEKGVPFKQIVAEIYF